MQDLEYTTDWLSDSTVFKVNTIDPHSDHHYYRKKLNSNNMLRPLFNL